MDAALRCANFEERRDKALELFAEKGFGQVSMRELAAHLGLTAGSLYHHFPSKQHLLFDLIEELYEELLATLTPRRRAQPQTLGEVIKAHWALHAERPLQFRLAERDLCCLSGEQQARIGQLRQQYESALLRLLAPGTTLCSKALQASAHVTANLLNSLPGWLQASQLQEAQGLVLMESLLLGGIERALQPDAV
ncbi:TetR/AcrR family transcriptional regulator [Pseudomonas rubra]|uniref:TetR/AcrR family transcriptional regulator n=1 Tax=Pseudomonas rubra TaxID=2942627 RepID=A0ABT5PE23_9PSED|nr:TetR/AcrR family transcriptional regulator [Pseudomonas rubra]MDD1016447.1 TetR/AcrR family transcriptional regulator [Pseudomonas rubra]MDD1036576.1 TetR/AcrR family transcriptional regulator [Pseudomonas rubra]MDD1156512.1 TetR/AcrR family transcriptional regulator [Pseudomonas rubra]